MRLYAGYLKYFISIGTRDLGSGPLSGHVRDVATLNGAMMVRNKKSQLRRPGNMHTGLPFSAQDSQHA